MTEDETTAAYSAAVEDWEFHRTALAAEQQRHDAAAATITAAMREAERVMHVAERAGALTAEAYVLDLRTGPTRLRRQYLGVKAYDRWDSQRADCAYNMAPSHGHIWFRIGLRRPADDLTETQRLACIRWLVSVEADPDGMLA